MNELMDLFFENEAHEKEVQELDEKVLENIENILDCYSQGYSEEDYEDICDDFFAIMLQERKNGFERGFKTAIQLLKTVSKSQNFHKF